MTSHHDEHEHEHGHEHGHGHGHEHGYTGDSLRGNDAYYAAVYREIIDWLDLVPGSSALEAGAGAGGFTWQLAEAIGPNGRVTALDVNQELLDVVRAMLEGTPLAARVSYRQGDISNLADIPERYSLVWSSRTVHHLPDQVAGVRALAGLLAPGGRLALREGGTRPHFLPDDIGISAPGLEARLEIANVQWFAANVRDTHDAVRYPYGWTQALRDGGLSDVTAKTFLVESLPPFSDVEIAYMGRQLKRWTEDEERRAMLDHDDVHALDQLTDPASEHFVFGRSDLHLTEAVTVYVGQA
jgi:SAM-dependent methyltransferase